MKISTNLFVAKEFKSIRGYGWRNFWILFAVFLLTVFALAFSRSGLKYLKYKMNDPFINWIDIKEQANFERFMNDININKANFNIAAVEDNNYILEYVFTAAYKKIRVEGRTIAHNSKLLDKILDGKNAIAVRLPELQEKDYGWIVTKDLMTRLGYDDEANYPLFLNYTFPGDPANINRLGIKNDKEYIAVPIPVIAVVNQLPDLLDFITPGYFMEQNTSESKPFNISMHEAYFGDLNFVAEGSKDELENRLKSALAVSGLQYDEYFEKEEYNSALRTAIRFRIIVRDSAYVTLNTIAEQFCNDSTRKIYRFYDYNFDKGYKLRANYLSFMFSDLTKVPAFAKWAKEQHGIRIDMTQIEAKNNFNIFNMLASLLCLFISLIAVCFVAIFLYVLIESHFRRISKNLGTIMAFGLGNKAIIGIYLAVFFGMIVLSLLSAVILLFGLEKLFGYLNFVREGDLAWFSISDNFAIGVIVLLPIVSAIVTVVFVHIKLRTTPGDLIFERNN
jgi:hypothetical protein